jgi:hypothetical protein
VRHLMGLVLAGGLLLGTAASSDAQVSVTVGSPFAGQGVFVGSGFGAGFGYPAYGLGYPAYGIGYPAYGGFLPGYGVGFNPVYRGGFSYSSGYRGFVGPRVGYGYGFAGRPYYGGFGYRGYGGRFR